MKIANRLKKFREEKGLTFKKVAEALDMPVSTYRDWEYGKSIRGEPYEKLARLFEVSLEELIVGRPHRREDLVQPLSEAKQNIETALKVAKAL